MSRNTDHEQEFSYQRPKLQLDRENKKVLGVCAGFARYLEVPTALVRLIYVIACLVSPFLLVVYLVLYWILEDERRPERIKAAMAAYVPGTNKPGSDSQTSSNSEAESTWASGDSGHRFDLKKPLYRSRSDVRVGGVCAGIADYLGIGTFIVRMTTFISIFILGGIMFWAYVICWIVLDKEPKSLQKSPRGSAKVSVKSTSDTGKADTAQPQTFERVTAKDCAERLQATERRLRNAEAFVTSRQFRLHCEINRI